MGDMQVIKPRANIYTVLAAVGTIAMILALMAVWNRYKSLFGENLFG